MVIAESASLEHFSGAAEGMLILMAFLVRLTALLGQKMWGFSLLLVKMHFYICV